MGARLGFPLGGELKRKGIEGLVTFDSFFPKGFDYWTVTADGLYHFTPFVEARYEIKDGHQFILAAGVYFGKS